MTTRGALPDVLIVGGGLIGCSCAYSLAKAGLRVLLLERDDLGAGASGACDGHLCCQSKSPGIHLKLAQRSLGLYDGLIDELDAGTGFRRCGSWLIAETAREWATLQSATVALRAAGLDVSLHTAAEVCREEPALSGRIAGGSYCPTDGQVDPWQLTLGFYRAARRLGAAFGLGIEVREITVQHGGVTGVHTASGHIAGGSVLVAAGAWSARLLRTVGVALPLRPRRGEILVTEPVPSLLSSILLHGPYLSAKLNRENGRPATLVMEQTAAGNLLIGSTRSYAGLDARNTAKGISAVAAEAARLVPVLGRLDVVRCFAGLRPCSGDGLPIIGPVPGTEALFVATGHEGDGVALTPVTAAIVADGIAGRPDSWTSELVPGYR